MNTAWYAPVNPTVPDSGPRWQPASTIPAQYAGDQYGGFVQRHPARTLTMRRQPTASVAALAARRGRARRLRDLRPLHRQAAGHDLGEHPRHDCHQRGPGTRAGRHDPGGRACRADPAWPPARRSRRRRRRSSGTPGSTSTGPRTASPAIQRELASLSTGQARAQALAGRRQLHARPDTRPKQRREQRPPRRHHVERHDARAVGPRDLRADERHRRLRRPPADAARHLRASHADPVGLGRKRMGTAELTCRSTHASVQKMDARLRCRAATHALRLALVYALLWTITLLGALLGTAFPGLAPGGRPHPALQESSGELASIAADNARVLSAPFLLAFFRFPAHRSDPSARRSADRRRARRERATRRARARPLAHPTPPVRAAAAARMAGRRSRRRRHGWP